MKLKVAFCLVAAAALFTAPAGANAAPMSNKALVTSFYRMMFVRHEVQAAADRFLGRTYIQHNPHVKNGAQPLLDYLVPYFRAHPDATVEIKRVLADGNLVMVHSHWRESPADRGSAVMDVFRVEDGRIVEHWDVVEPVPAHSANDNGMF